MCERWPPYWFGIRGVLGGIKDMGRDMFVSED